MILKFKKKTNYSFRKNTLPELVIKSTVGMNTHGIPSKFQKKNHGNQCYGNCVALDISNTSGLKPPQTGPLEDSIQAQFQHV